MVVADADTPQADADVPLVLGAYQLGPVIGTGSYGCVRLATNLEDWSRWAIKIVPQQTGRSGRSDDAVAKRLQEEVRISALLSHRNVLSLRESFHVGGYLCLVSSYAAGGDLMARLKASGRLPEDTAAEYFRQLVSGVRYLHAQGVAHRDLKPENLLLDASECLKITDFGLAATVGTSEASATQLRECCGTLHYTAPEVLRQLPYDGRAADMWSCGVILYLMLTERYPFHAPQKDQLVAKICKGEYVPLRNVSPFAQELVAGLLVLDPTKRLTAEAALSCPWLSPEPLRRFDRRQESLRDAVVLRAARDNEVPSGGAAPNTTPNPNANPIAAPTAVPSVPRSHPRSKTPSSVSGLRPKTAAGPRFGHHLLRPPGLDSHVPCPPWQPISVAAVRPPHHPRNSATPRHLSPHPSIHRH